MAYHNQGYPYFWPWWRQIRPFRRKFRQNKKSRFYLIRGVEAAPPTLWPKNRGSPGNNKPPYRKSANSIKKYGLNASYKIFVCDLLKIWDSKSWKWSNFERNWLQFSSMNIEYLQTIMVMLFIYRMPMLRPNWYCRSLVNNFKAITSKYGKVYGTLP